MAISNHPFRKIPLYLSLCLTLAAGAFITGVNAAPVVSQAHVRLVADSLPGAEKTRWARERCNCRPRRGLRHHPRRHMRRNVYYYGPTIVEYERAPEVYYRPAYIGGWGYGGPYRGGWYHHGRGGFYGGRGWRGGHGFGGGHGWGGGRGHGGGHWGGHGGGHGGWGGGHGGRWR